MATLIISGDLIIVRPLANDSSVIYILHSLRLSLSVLKRYIIVSQVKINTKSAANEYRFATYVITLHGRIEERQENIYIAVKNCLQS